MVEVKRHFQDRPLRSGRPFQQDDPTPTIQSAERAFGGARGPLRTEADRTPPAPEPLLLRPAEAARFLALSPRKLGELANTREVPAIRIGRALRYPTEELRAWVAGRRDRRS